MNKYIIDSWAWIEYFLATESGSRVKKIVEGRNATCFTSALSIAEVTVKLKKLNLDYDSAFGVMKSLSSILTVDEEIAFESALAYVEKRKENKDIGIVDVIIIVQARMGGLTIVTGDIDHFKNEKNVILLK